MRSRMTVKWLVILLIGLLAMQASAAEAPELKTTKERLSYGIGVDIGRNFKRLGILLDVDVMAKAMKDVFQDEKLLLSEAEIRQIMNAHQTSLRQRQLAARKELAVENKKRGETFLAENGKKEGVVTLPNGLQYKILKKGSGNTAKATDSIECIYRGTLIDGTEFDASPPGKTATFKVAGVIPGWREALKIMPVGSKWQLFIPPQLAYADRGAGRDIGPNATLIFELELLSAK